MANPPNILLITCDQLNASTLGAYGGPVPTPNLDRIAANGAVFENATCPTPICSPSRASLETGKYPHAHGIVHNANRRDYPAIPSKPTEEGIRLTDATLGKSLHEAGYRTHHYGKWHLLDDDLPYYPDMYREHAEYADEMAAVFAEVRRLPRSEWWDWYGWALPVDVSPALRAAVEALGSRWDGYSHAEFITKMGRLKLPAEQVFDARVADRAVDCLRHLDGRQPFFLVCSFNYPHDPNVVPSPFYEMFEPESLEFPANFDHLDARFEKDWSRRVVADLGDAGTREFLRLYDTAVACVDTHIGRVLDALSDAGHERDTLVVFASDHGDMAGGHGMVWKSTSAFYDEVMRVPLIMWLPGVIPTGRTPLETSLTDLMPTLLDFAGQPIPPDVQGTSLAAYLRGEKPAPSERFTFCERVRPHPDGKRVVQPGTPAAFAVRSREWKFVRYPDGGEFLYRLTDDPGETRNLLDDAGMTSQRRELLNVLEEWKRITGFPS